MVNIPKGTKDVLPFDSYKWQFIEDKAREICNLYNVKEIRTPIFEHTELFLRSIGEQTDVVKKEMYTFLDKGERSITLKPEGTAPVARSFIENSLDSNSLPLKVYYITPAFRYERPQAGRLREFHQFGAEFYGDNTPYMDAQAISLAYEYLKKIGLSDLVAEINSIGCEQCRKNYNQILKAYLLSRVDGLCVVCQERFQRNPLRILDCKNDSCKQIIKDAPLIKDHLCGECKSHFDGLQQILSADNIPYKVNPWIVRGLDYYTGPVFEFITTALGTQGTVCGGGRYDTLIQSMGGKSVPCVGFAMGLERLIMLIEQLKIEIKDNQLEFFVIAQSPECVEFCNLFVSKLRKNGHSADMDFLGKSIKAQFKLADRQKAKNIIVIGQNEVDSKIVFIKDQSTGQQKEWDISEIIG